jgi:hypothetical protein
MKYATARPMPSRKAAARVEIANTIEPVQDGRIYIEKINAPFLYRDRGTPAEYGAGLQTGNMGQGVTDTRRVTLPPTMVPGTAALFGPPTRTAASLLSRVSLVMVSSRR